MMILTIIGANIAINHQCLDFIVIRVIITIMILVFIISSAFVILITTITVAVDYHDGDNDVGDDDD